jgi:hypothetical protein
VLGYAWIRHERTLASGDIDLPRAVRDIHPTRLCLLRKLVDHGSVVILTTAYKPENHQTN